MLEIQDIDGDKIQVDTYADYIRIIIDGVGMNMAVLLSTEQATKVANYILYLSKNKTQ